MGRKDKLDPGRADRKGVSMNTRSGGKKADDWSVKATHAKQRRKGDSDSYKKNCEWLARA
jgi:hypothetical protein